MTRKTKQQKSEEMRQAIAELKSLNLSANRKQNFYEVQDMKNDVADLLDIIKGRIETIKKEQAAEQVALAKEELQKALQAYTDTLQVFDIKVTDIEAIKAKLLNVK